jgi:branched-chain amino acid transport system permease protein
MDLLIYGVVNSAILALVALGFSLVYGVSRVSNFAHGGLYTLTAFLAYAFFNEAGLSYPVSIILSLVMVTLAGACMYQFLLMRVRGMSGSEMIATFAVGLAIMEGLRAKGYVGETFYIPRFFEGSTQIAGVPLDWQRISIVGVALIIMIILWLFTHFTKVGLSLSAIAQDERAAMMLGMDSDRGAVIALALGSAVAGLASVAITPLGNISVESGYQALINAIAVCIIGGLGSWAGTVIAAFVLGFAQTLTVGSLGPEWQMVVVVLAILLLLIAKPSGLLGKQKALEERV